MKILVVKTNAQLKWLDRKVRIVFFEVLARSERASWNLGGSLRASLGKAR